MKKELVIQRDNAKVAHVEAFVESLCDEMGADNERGIISMAVLQAVALCVEDTPSEGSATVRIEADRCQGGVYVQLSGEGLRLPSMETASLVPEAGRVGERLFVLQRLADVVQLSDQGDVIRMEFLLRGVESPFAHSRQHVLQEFYAFRSVEA